MKQSNMTVTMTPSITGEASEWKKGALHAHTLWSDGRSLTEVAIHTYRELGYDFVCLSDHNVFQSDPQVWLTVAPEEGSWPNHLAKAEYERSRELLPDSLDEKNVAFRTFVRLKTFADLRREFECPGKFLLVGGEEITVMEQQMPDGGRRHYHLNILNLEENFLPLFGKDGAETIRLNYEQYRNAQQRAKHPTFLMLNHPFWPRWDIEPGDLLANPEVQHFEICNNGTDVPIPKDVCSREKFWDIVLAHRLEDGKGILYAAAGDDAHFYDPDRIHNDAGCNLAWVMVHCPDEFTADNITEALNRGDYYPTCGVLWSMVEFDSTTSTLYVKAQAEKNVNYRIEFITTKRGFNRRFTEADYPGPTDVLFRRLPTYSNDIGRTVLAIDGAEGSYTMMPDDLYVRAIVISDRATTVSLEMFPETERAWTQPYFQVKSR